MYVRTPSNLRLDAAEKRLAEVEAFLEAESEALAAAPTAVKQTRERLRLDEDVQQRATPALAAWLNARSK